MEREQEETKFPEGFSAFHSTMIAAGFGALLLVVLMAAIVLKWLDPREPYFLTGTIILWTGLMALTWYDCFEFRLPDLMTLPLVITGLTFALNRADRELMVHVTGGILGYGLIWCFDFV